LLSPAIFGQGRVVMDGPQYKIGRFILKPNRQLLDGDADVPVGRKALELLSVLAKAEGALVTKDELMAAVWPKTIVEDNALQAQIAALRKALSDDAGLLHTVHGLGYRLEALSLSSSPGPSSSLLPRGQEESVLPATRAEVRRLSPRTWALASVLLVLSALAFTVFVRGQLHRVPTPAREARLSISLPGAENIKSIAVLPFNNFSGDSGQEYFSDGMTEEITAAIAKIPNLAVVGRTSAFQFKGKSPDLRTVGKILNAAYLLEGSVRKIDARVRVTAQLIRADTGAHLWTENYDRDLADVFAVQEDIARAIATALQEPLGLKGGENLVSNRTSDTAAYEDYLRAVALAYNNGDIKQSIALLESVVARDPEYAPAWAFLAIVYPDVDELVGFDKAKLSPVEKLRADYRSAMARTETAARNALRLDPNNALAYAALGDLENLRAHWATADDDFAKALALDPSDPLILDKYGNLLQANGRLKQALKVHTRMRQAEPLVADYYSTAATTILFNGDAKRAIALAEQTPAAFAQGSQFHSFLALDYAGDGQYQKAAETIGSIRPDQVLYPASDIKTAAEIIRAAPAKSASASLSYLSPLAWVYIFAGEPKRFMDVLDYQGTAVGLAFPQTEEIWIPALAGARKTERFKQLVRSWGLVDYWRARGWPDLCRPVGADDFACR